jgi:citrate lyase subunit beta/citryl-CoA lyase
MRLRSLLAIPPGEGPSEAALASEADAIVVALNDARHAAGRLRELAVAALPRIRAAGKLPLVIVNHPRTQLLRDDMDAVVTPDLAAVLLPHAADPQDFRDLGVLLREFEYQRGIEPGNVTVFPVIDTARGLLRAAQIVEAVPRSGGLLFDAAAYARDTGAREETEGPRLSYARGKIVAAARAFDRSPLVAASARDARSLAQAGFAGALVRDLAAISVANAAFTPTKAAVERAAAHASGYEAARAEGAWVARVGREVADAHSARKANLTMEAGEPPA